MLMRKGNVARASAAVVVGVLLVAAGCSSSSSQDASSGSSGTSTGSPSHVRNQVDRPAGPSADVSVELSGGNGVFMASSAPAAPVLEAADYVEHEYVASGTATGYAAEGALTLDGRWTFQPSGTAPYTTRVLVRRPADASKFSGTVVVEWLNVSSGIDSDAEWQTTHEEITRRGDIWVGVSAQLIGINGGAVAVSTPEAEAGGAGKGLRALDPARYGTLNHPGDGYAFDIYTQVARSVRDGGSFLGGSTPDTVIAIGQSQSAFALTTYVNGVQPLTLEFDGFLLHSRGASGLPIAAPGEGAGVGRRVFGPPAILRTDTTVPIVELQSETDLFGVINSYGARQDDTDSLPAVGGGRHRARRPPRGRRGARGRSDAARSTTAPCTSSTRRRTRRSSRGCRTARHRRRHPASRSRAMPNRRWPRRGRHRPRRHPHAAGRRPGRRALGRARRTGLRDLHPLGIDDPPSR